MGQPGPGGILLPAQDRPDDVLGGDRRAVVMGDREQPVGQRAAQGRLQDRRDLGVAVLLDDVNPQVPLDEMLDFVGDGQGADAAVLGGDPFVAELVAGFDHRPVRAAVGDQADLAAGLALDDRRRQGRAGGLELAHQPVEVLLPILGTLAVARFLVVAGAASEISRQRVLGAGNRAVADAVAVDVLVALELAQALQVLGVQDLAVLDRLGGIGERLGEPEVHPQIEVGRHEDGGLELLGQVERLDGQRVAFLDRAGDQHDMAGVAVAQEVELEDVSLAGAGGQARCWAPCAGRR